VSVAAYHAWAVLDIEQHDDVVDPDGPGLRGDLQALISRSLVTASIPEVGVMSGGASERFVLGFVPETPPCVIAKPFFGALIGRLTEHNRERDPAERLRITVAVHDGRSAGSFAEVLRVADAPVLKKVLATARRSAVAVAASEAWYAEALGTANGYSRVRSGADTFWISVPGTSAPPGLSPADVAPSSTSTPGARARRPRTGDRTVNVTINGPFHGDQIAGDKIIDGSAARYDGFGS
jgi:hypothetical protein